MVAESSVSFGDTASRKETFIKEAMLLRQALSLCRSLLTPAQRFEAAYFEAARTLLTRITGEGKPLSLKEINARVNELLKASIQSEGVINLFSDVDTGFSLFDSKFLEEIAKMKEKNLAVEILKKLLAEQVSLYRRTNLVKSEKFSEMLSRAMKAYLNGMLSNEELVAMTHELTDMLRKNRTIDWQKKESARAGMRRMVKKLLKKHKYPPEGMETAVATVIGQCEI
jgi:type I restriction enzyme R subunit